MSIRKGSEKAVMLKYASTMAPMAPSLLVVLCRARPVRCHVTKLKELYRHLLVKCGIAACEIRKVGSLP